MKPNRRWYLDSGYSRHMTGDIDQFFTTKSKDEGFITFEDNKKGRIIGLGNIKISPSTFIENVLLSR